MVSATDAGALCPVCRPNYLCPDSGRCHGGPEGLFGTGLFTDVGPQVDCQCYGAGVLFHVSGRGHYAGLWLLY